MTREERERLEEAVKRMENREVETRRKEGEDEARRKWKREEREKRAQGKGAFYLKKSALAPSLLPHAADIDAWHPCDRAHRGREDSRVAGSLRQPVEDGQAPAAQEPGEEEEKGGGKGQKSDAASSSFGLCIGLFRAVGDRRFAMQRVCTQEADQARRCPPREAQMAGQGSPCIETVRPTIPSISNPFDFPVGPPPANANGFANR